MDKFVIHYGLGDYPVDWLDLVYALAEIVSSKARCGGLGGKSAVIELLKYASNNVLAELSADWEEELQEYFLEDAKEYFEKRG